MTAFIQRLLKASESNQSLLCVGLDPDPSLMAISDMLNFNRSIVAATKDLVCAYKPNLSFYEAHGSRGIQVLEQTVSYIRAEAPGIIVLGDAKRGDIASTNRHYAKALFDVWGFDAATVNAYGGGEALEPFFEYREKGIFVWCRSSNSGAAEFQDLILSAGSEKQRLYKTVAAHAFQWNHYRNVGLVVGATYPRELGEVRSICPDMPILVPAVGTQAGDLEAAVTAGMNANGRNILISSSRSVLYASHDQANFAQAARKAAEGLRCQINLILEKRGNGW